MNKEAFYQWRKRKDDEIFHDLDQMLDNAQQAKLAGTENTMPLGNLEFRGGDNDLEVWRRDYKNTSGSLLTAWAFEQMCQHLNAPAGFLRELTADLACDILNQRLTDDLRRDKEVKILNEGVKIRAITGPRYGRLWDADLIRAVRQVVLESGQFVNPDRSRGVDGGPTGLYRSDRDSFMFFVDKQTEIDLGTRAKMNRGFFTWNSEVGATSVGVGTFLFNSVCSNHMIMGFKDMGELRLIHTGNVAQNMQDQLMPMLKAFMEVDPETEKIRLAQETPLYEYLGLPKDMFTDTLLNLLVSIRLKQFSKSELNVAYHTAVSEEGKCETLWDLVMGLTAVARDLPQASAKVDLERRAGALIDNLVLK